MWGTGRWVVPSCMCHACIGWRDSVGGAGSPTINGADGVKSPVCVAAGRASGARYPSSIGLTCGACPTGTEGLLRACIAAAVF